jgi:hypothetical protein
MQPPVNLDLTGDYAIRQGMTYTLGFQIVGSSPGEDDAMIDTAAMTARFKIRANDFDGDVHVEGSTDDGRVAVGYSPPPVERSTAYVLNQQVTADPYDGYLYECVVAGTTAAGAVAYDDTIGNDTVDGTATFECIEDAAENVVNAYILLPASYTATIVDWGRGVWDFELEDGSTVFRLFEGIARLSREVTY